MAKDKYKEHSDGTIYKLWDKKKENYLYSSAGTTWRSLHWVSQKLLDLKKWSPNDFDPSNYEIHEFKIVFSQSLDSSKILEREFRRRNQKKYAEKRLHELTLIIMRYFSGIDSINIALRIYDSGMLKESFVSELDPLFKEYKECQKIIEE